jgi:hypothetical protein
MLQEMQGASIAAIDVTDPVSSHLAVSPNSALTLLTQTTGVRMKKPVRSRFCNHTRCFDAFTFLERAFRTNSLHCPICNAPAFGDALLVDAEVKEAIRQAPHTI